MKKWLLILGMITCMAGLTACGQSKEESDPLMTAQEAEEYAETNISAMNQIVQQGAQDQVSDPVWVSALESWIKASEDMGSYEEIISTTSEFDKKDGVIDATIKGSKRNAVVEFVFDEKLITGVAVNVEYTFGEKMEKAALNTLLGMGTVFVVLILISGIISCFGFIPKLQEKFTRKPREKEVKAAVDNTIAQIIEKEELSDDLELVAVISAAIAASEGAASTDGFVVRSIKRAGNKWQRA